MTIHLGYEPAGYDDGPECPWNRVITMTGSRESVSKNFPFLITGICFIAVPVIFSDLMKLEDTRSLSIGFLAVTFLIGIPLLGVLSIPDYLAIENKGALRRLRFRSYWQLLLLLAALVTFHFV